MSWECWTNQVAEHGQLFRAEHATSLRSELDMEAHDVRLAEELLHRNRLSPNLGRPLRG